MSKRARTSAGTAAKASKGSHVVNGNLEGVKAINHPVDDAWVESAFASRYTSAPVPKDRFPDASMPAPVAYQLIRDMRQLDSNPRLNLASFVDRTS